LALTSQPEVYGVRIAEEVVQISQDLLVCSGEEDPEDVLIAVGERVQLERPLFRAAAGESVDLSVGVAGDVVQRSMLSRLFVQPVDRQDGKELVDRPGVRE